MAKKNEDTNEEPANLNEEGTGETLKVFDEESEGFIRKSSILNQITRGSAVMIATVSLAASVLVFFFGRQYLLKTVSDQLLDSAHSNVIIIQQALQARANFLMHFAENGELMDGFRQNNAVKIRSVLNNEVTRERDIEGIWILDQYGNVIAANQKKGAGTTIEWAGLLDKNYAAQEWFTSCLNSKMALFYPEQTDIPTRETNMASDLFMWTQPMPSETKGCVLIFESINQLSRDVYTKLMFLKTRFASKRLIGRGEVSESLRVHLMSESGKIYYSTKSVNTSLKSFIEGPEGYGRANINGVSNILAWSRLKEHIDPGETLYWDGVVVVQMETSEAAKPLQAMIIILLLIVIVVTISATYLVYRASRSRIREPMTYIENAVDEISSGNLIVDKLHLQDEGDMGYLAHRLNQLLERFRDLISLILKSGTEVMGIGRNFFINLGNIQKSSNDQVQLLESADRTISKFSAVAGEIDKLAQRQLDGAETNQHAMNELKDSFEQYREKRQAITKGAENVVSKSQAGLRTIDEFADNVQNIAESSKRIRGIIGVIDDLADQTNLLALNASIEAARAGKHGKGFSVVANEVSELAKRSARSAEEIAALIKETVQQVVDVSKKVENAKGFFNQIVKFMSDLDERINEMEEFTKRQEIAVVETAERAKTVAGLAKSITNSTKEQIETAIKTSDLMKQATGITSKNVEELENVDEILLTFMDKIQTLLSAARKFKVIAEEQRITELAEPEVQGFGANLDVEDAVARKN